MLETIIAVGTTVVTTMLMMILYRMHGGMPPKLPWKFDEILIGAIIAAPIYFMFGWQSAIVVGLWAAVLKVKGHGQYMNLKFLPPWPRRIKPEDWDIFLKPVFGVDPRTTKDYGGLHHSTKAKRIRDYGLSKLYRRCVAGLFISGASVGVGLSVVLALQGWLLMALAVFFGYGFSKAVAYPIGWKIFPNSQYNPDDQLDEPTEVGEMLAGVAPGLITGLLLYPHLINLLT